MLCARSSQQCCHNQCEKMTEITPATTKAEAEELPGSTALPVIQAEIGNNLLKTEVMPYTQGADFFLWFTPTVRRLAMMIAVAPVLIAFLGYVGVLQTVFFPLAVMYINLIKPFLTMPALPAMQNLLYQNGEYSIYWFWGFCAIGVAIAATISGIALRPNALCITDQTLSFGKSLETQPGEVIFTEKWFLRFADVESVDIIRPKNTKSNLDYKFVFHRYGFKNALSRPVRLRYGDILTSGDRARFLAAVKEHFGDQIDDEKLEPFEAVSDNTSYTELWLKELSAPPKRNKLTPLEIGTQLNNGRFTIISKIGSGGQGTVYLAQDNHNFKDAAGTEVVLKEFLLPVFPDSRVRKAAAVKFQEEADLLGKLSHAQIVKFYTLFLEDHRAYLVLEKLDGNTLKEYVEAKGAVPAAMAIDLASQMCEILSYLHNQSPPVVHRDFTPDNLILSEDGRLKLLDFSVAQSITSNVTGSVVGKPHYLAPEQFRGKATSQSDIYSFGATIYFLVTGKQPEPITNLKLDASSNDMKKVAGIIEKATKLDTANRYKKAEDILKDLA
jgi:tRNA A-37 threonylcarbamoyl transferase component Bud32